MAVQENVIKTSPAARNRRLRQRLFPWVAWFLAVSIAVWLYQRQGQRIDAVGLVQVEEVGVAPVGNGRIQSIEVGLLEEVDAGQVLVFMDDGDIEDDLRSIRRDLERIRLAVNEGRQSAGRLSSAQQDRLANTERLLSRVELQIQDEVNALLLVRTRQVLDRQESMVASGALEASVARATAQRLAVLEAEASRTRSMLDATQPDPSDAPGDAAAEPFSDFTGNALRGLSVLEARILGVQARRESRRLRAPSAGTVTALPARPGDEWSAGSPAVIITGHDSGTIVAYVDARLARALSPTGAVRVVARDGSAAAIEAQVVRVGRAMVERPVQLRRTQGTREWGVPVLMQHASPEALFPGQVVDLQFLVD